MAYLRRRKARNCRRPFLFRGLGYTVKDGESLGYIPNQVHFVYVLADPAADFGLRFSHYLSIYAAWRHWNPEKMYLHTNAHASSVDRATNGTSGKWDGLIFNMPGLEVRHAEVPTHADNGREIQDLEHKSDFVRVKAVRELGGVYIDWDVHALRDVRVLRESGFRAVAGRQLGGQVNSGVFMSVAGGKLMALWEEGMHEAYTGGWTTHSNEVITKFAERLVAEPGEALIMEREAFAPGSWNAEDNDMLFAVHEDVPSNLANVTQGDALPGFDEGFADRWERPGDSPSWERDWPRSYMLHAFSPHRFGHKVTGFKHITPRYVLERRSNFARAVYPIAREMYNEGIIEIDDSHQGV
ncbi:glycosyltransferase family 32 protein [Sodiomyces alcalophilus JCM 7366]|uniref:glycosyltransferase family 32 protein n=1 Tax=Sodiomyces alcalophilus JCM 7366 TaxID=591952 RepID=UPI0039B3DFF0